MRSIGADVALSWRAAVGALLLALAWSSPDAANGSNFDHLTTGFELIGQHRSAACEGCHVGGVFKGTPKDCFACHAAGARTGASAKPTNHILSSDDCSQCHTEFGWRPVARFNHLDVIATCSSCHNNVQSRGKSPGHVLTTLECGICHSVSQSWASAKFIHAGITGNCASCHDNVHAVGMPAGHVPSSAPCETCHSSADFRTFAGTAMNHVGIASNCQACHETGMSWYGLVMVDRPTVAQDPTHPLATAPEGADCAICHQGVSVGDFSKNIWPANHIPTSQAAQCSSCHTTPDLSLMPTLASIHAFAPSTTGNCAQCHGSAAPSFAIPRLNFSIVGVPSSHVPTTAACETCHVGAGSSIAATPVVDGAKFSGSAMNHAGLATCVACHGPTVTSFTGINSIIVMPATSPAGTGAHIPSGTACEACHQGAMPTGLVPANATVTAPGTRFATPVPSTEQVHAGISGGCAACHEGGAVWLGMNRYPISPTSLTGSATTQYTGFNTRPGKTASAFTLADGAHPSAGDCGQCHGNTHYFEGVLKPSNHIPTATSAQCTNCHIGTDFSVMPSLTAIHAYAPSKSANCAQCHGSAAATFAIPAANFSIVGLPTNHLPTTASCEQCHVGAGSSIAATPVVDGARFSGSKFGHAGLTTCVGCHGPSVSGTSFAGVTRIIVMPLTIPAGPGAHIPASTACEACHLASMPAGLVAASATLAVPGSLFSTPAPSTAQIHAGVSGGCNACHESGSGWVGMGRYPLSPAALSGTATTQYIGFNTRPGAVSGTFALLDGAHPTAGDCGQCHGNTNYFEGLLKPSNHIPTATAAKCSGCHTATDFSVMPTLSAIHANAPSTSANCAQCHGSAAASFAIPAANFAIVGLPANHLPTARSCEVCHVGAGSSVAATPVTDGARFANSRMSHAGATTCVACHGPNVTTFAGVTRIVVIPATSPSGAAAHIPSTTACETCHQASTPSSPVAANAASPVPGSLFMTPAPTTAQIHAGVAGGCATCHEGGTTWLGMSQFPISPAALTGDPATHYTGFNTRPGATAGTFMLADGLHPASGDCGACHGNTNYFDAVVKPVNHVPTAPSASCSNCHTSSDFSVLPTLANIHTYAPSTTANCAQCHGGAAPSFAIPSANFSIVGLPSNHLPTSQSCEVCHVGAGSSVTKAPVPNGAKFSGSRMNHAGVTTCVSCHGPSISSASFVGINRIVVMPAISPAGPSSHIPTASTCETCHAGSMPGGLVAANATATVPGSLFATPVPSTSQIHAGVTGGCNACHESGYVWLDVAKYPISPTKISGTSTTQYLGFNTRPGAAAGPYTLADRTHPSSGDCSQCHGNTSYFEGVPKPTNHIPVAAAATCTNCHVSTDFSVIPTVTAIHAYAPSTTTGCDQCHGSAAASFAIPAVGFAIVGLPSNHLPTSQSCEVCHVGAGSSMTATPVVDGARFSNSYMNHAGLSSCVACHGPNVSTFAGVSRIVVMPPTSPAGPAAHIPSTTACEACHQAAMPVAAVPASATIGAPGTKFMTPVPTTAQIHAGISGGCAACHENGSAWMDMTQYPVSPAALTGLATTQYVGFNTRPGKSAGTFTLLDSAHPSSGDCGQCHANTNFFEGVLKPANHIPTATSSQCSSCHVGTDFSVMPTLTAIHAYAPSTTRRCDQCHGGAAASFSIPAANFAIVDLPSNHLPTSQSCEVCHIGAASSIAATPVVDGAKFTASSMNHAGLTTCVTCHGPAVTGFAGISRIIVIPATSPASASSHIPSSTACESCHLATMPSGPVPANATLGVPGSRFLSPAPTTAQVHAGTTGACAACHEGGNTWLDMGQYPISPVALTGISTTQYVGFNTRPGPTAGTFSVADGLHPSSGDCGQCHGNTNYFDAVVKPANHIPTAPTASCTNCHTSGDFSAMPTLTAIHAYAPSSTAACDQCHGSAAPSFAIPGANFSIVGLPSNHLPTLQSCEVCHIGAGSSIAATPVVNGAKFTNSAMNHAALTTCAACHGAGISGASFAGITKIVVMPPTSPTGPNSHIPAGSACESCHQGSMPAGLVPGNAKLSVPGTAFMTPVPSNAQIHAGMTSGCTACHEGGSNWVGMAKYPISPTALSGVATTQYLGFNTRPGKTSGTFTLADPAHPASGDCVQCHGGTSYFEGLLKPSNHIPVAATSSCTNCHTGTDFSVTPTLLSIHTYAPSQTSNCAQCHGSAAASFAIPAANFSIVGLPSNHLPTSQSCEVCHVGAGSSVPKTPVANGSKFSGSKMSHIGLTTCDGCHGPAITGASFLGISKIIVMPATTPAGAASAHIPSGNACESCHAASMPTGLVAASSTLTVPGSLFATPAPSTAQIHSGVTSGCSACHEGGYQWMDMTKYPISPKTLTAGSQYTGFQTRPGAVAGAYMVKDAGHPNTGDCQSCHGGNTSYFAAIPTPTNHIPTASTSQCVNCHTGTDYSVMPTLTAIHAYAPSTTSNCTQCHGSAAASFAIPAANFSVVGLPSGHLPTSQSCEVCHVGAGSSIAATPVVNGAKFTSSKMSHVGLTTCVTCHGPTISGSTFAGISKIVVMPSMTPAGAGTAHIPTSTACESCHQSSMPSGLVTANATLPTPGSLFAMPAPTTAQIHAGVTSGCQSCHEAPYAWMDMAKYPISPSTFVSGSQYTGFQTRPGSVAGTFVVKDSAHPATGDCVSCHGTNFNSFASQIKPANHIPTSTTATCTNCHAGSDFAAMPTLLSIHTYAPSQTSNCAQCHGSAASSFAIPAANFSIVGLPSNHLPTTQSCEVCHVGAGSSVAATPVPNGAKFSGSKMSHLGLTTCVACHGPTISGSTFVGISKVVVMPPTTPAGAATAHIATGTACESCHLASMPSGLVAANATLPTPGSLFATPVPTTAQIHAGVTAGCQSCHEAPYAWMDMAKYPISPTTFVAGSQYTGFQTRPGLAGSTFVVKDAAHPTSGDCVSCHGTNTNYFASVVKPSNHIPTSTTAICTNCHTGSDFSVMPTLLSIHTYAPSQTSNCTQCHGSSASSFAIPAANFSIVGLPSNHLPTTQSCEVCHVGTGSSVATTPVPNGSKFSGSKMSHGGITTCVACHGPTIGGSSFVGVSKIIVMPPTTPAGAGSAHIPSGTACEGCHLGSMPTASIAATATLSAPGSLFANPAPTTIQIHAGVTSGCQSCHEGTYQWMGMAKYPLAPGTKVANASTQYTGFQTRPGAAAGTYMSLDAAHPATGDCVTCHGASTAYFTGQAEPANHIPTLAGAACSTCHTTPGNYAVYTTNLSQLHSAVPTTCSTCHTDGKGPFAGVSGFTIIQMSTRGLHIPITNGGFAVECSGCHKLVTAFSGTIMSHGAIGDTATAAAGNACDACHELGYRNKFFGVAINWTRDSATHHLCGAAGTPTAPNVQLCSGGGSDCLTGCHEHANNIPATYKRAPRPRVQTGTPAAAPAGTTPGVAPGASNSIAAAGVRPIHRGGLFAGDGGGIDAVVDHRSLGGKACQSCHNGALATGVGAVHPRTSGTCADCHSTMAWSPVLRVDHADVVGKCVSCHTGGAAMGKPASHIQSGSDCDRCHTTSAWKPAAFDHAGVIPGICASCHTGLQAAGKPGRHVPTMQSCDACHYVLGWVPAKPPQPPARHLTPTPRGPVLPRDRAGVSALH